MRPADASRTAEKTDHGAAQKAQRPPSSNGHAVPPKTNGHSPQTTDSSMNSTAAAAGTGADTDARLEAMSQEREALRVEVEQLRKQLEGIQETHNHETTQLKSDLEESEAAKEQA